MLHVIIVFGNLVYKNELEWMSKVNFYRNTAKIVKNNAPKTPKMAPENMAAQNLVDLGKRESSGNDYGPKSSEN